MEGPPPRSESPQATPPPFGNPPFTKSPQSRRTPFTSESHPALIGRGDPSDARCTGTPPRHQRHGARYETNSSRRRHPRPRRPAGHHRGWRRRRCPNQHPNRNQRYHSIEERPVPEHPGRQARRLRRIDCKPPSTKPPTISASALAALPSGSANASRTASKPTVTAYSIAATSPRPLHSSASPKTSSGPSCKAARPSSTSPATTAKPTARSAPS